MGRRAGSFGSKQVTRLAASLWLGLLAACSVPSPSTTGASQRSAAAAPLPRIKATPAQPVVAVPKKPEIPSAATDLDRTLLRLGASFSGDVGLAVRDIQTGWTSDYRGLDYFPQQSVSKLWVALTAFHLADQQRLDFSSPRTLSREDLTLFHQPIRALVLRPGGFQTTLDDLLFRALTQSDNSANQAVLNAVGGPEVVKETLRTKGVLGIRFGPGERAMQSQIAGLEWKQDYAIGGRFYAARDAVPAATRRSAFDAYVADPVDGAQPLAMVDTLARLKTAKLLSPEMSARMLSIMGQTRTGPQRLKGGLQPGWTLSHKTGTGQVLSGVQAGYNDVGVLTSPEGRSYALAVLIGRTSEPLIERMALMQQVVSATIDYDNKLRAQIAAAPPEDAKRHDGGTGIE